MRPEKKVLRTLRQAGFKAYLVGGAVRDRLLGLKAKDADIATDARPEEVIGLFEKTVPTGLAFGTVSVIEDGKSIEVTTFRSEDTYSDGRRPDHVRFGASLKTDLSRRDFTVNALAEDEDGTIIDYYGGQEDLAKKLIRAIGKPKERFEEDGLRKWRAVRFACTKNFAIEEETFDAIVTDPDTRHISTERITDELLKILASDDPARGFRLLDESGLLPSFFDRFGLDYPGPANFERADKTETRLAQLYGYYGEAFLDKLTLPKRKKRIAQLLYKLRQSENKEQFNILARELGRAELEKALDYFEGKPLDLAKKLLASPAFSRKELDVDGHDLKALGLEGEQIKRALDDFLTFVYDHPEKNKKTELLQVLNERIDHGTYFT